MKNYLHIQKSSGVDAEFSRHKIEKSLIDAGASVDLASDIAGRIEDEIDIGMSTRDVFNLALKYLKQAKLRPVAARYSLKRAIINLGPSGYPFENFVGELFKKMGYGVRVGVIVQGACVTHEIDVLAHKKGETSFVECKFHNEPGYNTNVKVPLYIHSRYNDIKKEFENNESKRYYKPWIVTNTRFSNDAIKYGECNGITLIGWSYPREGNLHDLIEKFSLHPISCLTSLSENAKIELFKNNVVLCSDAFGREDLLYRSGMRDEEVKETMDEIRDICKF